MKQTIPTEAIAEDWSFLFESGRHPIELGQVYAFLDSPDARRRLSIVDNDESHIWFSTKTYLYEVCEPHSGNGHAWFFRKARKNGFDRWANSADEERFYESFDDLLKRLRRI